MKGIISRGCWSCCRERLQWLLKPERMPDAINDVAYDTCRFAVVHSNAIDRRCAQWWRFNEKTATARPYMASLSEKLWINEYVLKFTRNSLNFLACCVTHHVSLSTFDSKKEKDRLHLLFVKFFFWETVANWAFLNSSNKRNFHKNKEKGSFPFFFFKMRYSAPLGWMMNEPSVWMVELHTVGHIFILGLLFFYYYYFFLLF